MTAEINKAVAFMEQAGAMLGRGEMPAPATPFAVEWHAAHAAILSELSRLREENAALTQALEPFGGEFAATFVDENGWTGPMSKTRIVDWFGPSDFRRAATLSRKSKEGGE